MAEVRATPLPQVGNQLRPVMDKAAAGSSGYQAVAPQVHRNGEMASLVNGLSDFNSSLKAYTNDAVQQQEAISRQETVDQSEADAAKADRKIPIDMLYEQPVPGNVPVSLGGLYRHTFAKALAKSSAVTASAKLAAEYDDASKDPAFNAESFFATKRQEYLGGIYNPALVGPMADSFDAMATKGLQAAEVKRMGQLKEQEDSSMAQVLNSVANTDMTSDQLVGGFQSFREYAKGLGRSQKEAAGLFFTKLVELSSAKEGDPRVFDALNLKDEHTGLTVLEMNPDLAQHVGTAKQHAKLMQEKALEVASQKENVPIQIALDEQSIKDPASITVPLVMSHVSPHGLFATKEQATAYYWKAQERLHGAQLDAQLDQAAMSGMLGRYPESEQKAYMEAKLGPWATKTWQEVTSSGDPKRMAQFADELVARQSTWGATIPYDPIKRIFETAATTLPDKNAGPSNAFLGAFEVYKKLAGAPQFRDMYFNEKAAKIMDAYKFATDNGDAPKAAHERAYTALSDGAKANAQELVKSPDFQGKLKKIYEDVAGTSFASRWIPFWPQAENKGLVSSEAKQFATQYAQQNPGLTAEQVSEKTQQWVSRNFVQVGDEVVKVPAGKADENTVKGFEMMSKSLMEQASVLGYEKVSFIQVSEGLYQPMASSGSVSSPMGPTVPLEAVRSGYTDSIAYSPEDTAALNALKQQVRTGTIDPAFLATHASTFAKAKRLGGLPGSDIKQLEAAYKKTIRTQMDAIPSFPGMQVDATELQHTRYGNKVDNKLTGNMAMDIWTSAQPKGMSMYSPVTPSQAMAGSLIAVSEGVALKAIMDPNPKAGLNIGTGYNLKANAATLEKDFVRAGIPVEAIPALKEGKAQLTPTQAQALLMRVTLPRYEKLASEAINKTASGAWDSLTNQQKAVATDMAWQMGDVSKFTKAWNAMVKNDMDTFATESKVFYRNGKDELVEDKRRWGLRQAMLAGPGRWVAEMKKYRGFTNGAIDVAAANNK